jgi:hypothetical protein
VLPDRCLRYWDSDQVPDEHRESLQSAYSNHFLLSNSDRSYHCSIRSSVARPGDPIVNRTK